MSLRWRLRLWYILAIGAVGAMLPFLAVYLEGVGITGSTKAIVLSMFPVGAFLSGPVWGYVAERVSQARYVLMWASFLSAACAWIAAWTQQGSWLLVALLVLSICQSPLVGLVDALAMKSLEQDPHSYGRIRLWGSVAYLGAVWVVGDWIEVWPPISLVLSAFMLLAAAFLTLHFPALERTNMANTSSSRSMLRELWQNTIFRTLWWLGMAQCLGLSLYNYLFAFHIKQLGLPPHAASLAMTLGIGLEVAIMAVAPSLFHRFGTSKLLLIGIAAGIPRWFFTAWSPAYVVIAAQTLHGLVFGLWWITSMSLLNRYAPDHLRYFSQSIFMLTVQGIGPIVAMSLAYFTLDSLPARNLFLVAFVLNGLSFLYAWIMRHRFQ